MFKVFPEWTEEDIDDIDAIQHLKLNELRDDINEAFFPYLTSVMPHFRLVSWLVWVYYRLELERKNSEKEMYFSEYREKAVRFYSIFATADILHMNHFDVKHNGPVGVEKLSASLAGIEKEDVDFSMGDFIVTNNPINEYKNGIINMGLLQEIPFVFGRQRKKVLVLTNKGIKLATTFQKNWAPLVSPDDLAKKLIWKQQELIQLGEVICLQKLSKNDEEAKILLESASSSIRDPVFNDFLNFALLVSREYDKNNLLFNSEDIAKTSLYWSIRSGDSFKKIEYPKTESSSLLAYHELHSHTAYAADAILTGVVKIAKSFPGGIKTSSIIEEAAQLLEKNKFWTPSLKIQDLIHSLKLKSNHDQNLFQKSNPPADGPYGFETIRSTIKKFDKEPQGLVAWGTIAALQAAAFQNSFENKWLRSILPLYQESFGSYTFFVELESLNNDSNLQDWIKKATNLVINQHRLVAESKGSYSKRIEKVGEYIYYRADAGYVLNRGRFPSAISWLSDVGILQFKDTKYSISKEEK